MTADDEIRAARLAAAVAVAWERCTRWPEAADPGRYRITCTCGKWEAEGTAREVLDASRAHDDSPWFGHVVIMRWKAVEVPDREDWRAETAGRDWTGQEADRG